MKKYLISTIAFFIVFSASAENIDVKYFGRQSLDEYECSYVSSSVVNRICFSDKSNNLILQLRDTYYAYCRVPKLVVQNLTNAPSIGRYYNDNIRGNYDCR